MSAARGLGELTPVHRKCRRLKTWLICFFVCQVACYYVQDLFAQEPETRRIQITLKHTITPGENTKSVTWTTLIPVSIPGKQTVHEIKYSVEPTRTFRRRGNGYAVFTFQEPRAPIHIDLTITADLIRHDYETLSQLDLASDQIESITDRTWLRDETYLEAEAAVVVEAAAAIEGETRRDRIENTLRFVTSTLTYGGFRQESAGAAKSLETREGDCSEFSDLFVALCRAQGIPARTCDGLLVMKPEPGDTARHKWTEVYLEDLGWIPLDPLRVAKRTASFARLPNQYLYLTHLRNDSSLNNYEIAFYRYEGDPIEFESSFELHDLDPRERRD